LGEFAFGRQLISGFDESVSYLPIKLADDFFGDSTLSDRLEQRRTPGSQNQSGLTNLEHYPILLNTCQRLISGNN
jgi:hypothetical protein